MLYYNSVNFSELVGKTITQINNLGDKLIFFCETGEEYEMLHEQSCCESVYIEEIVGDLEDLLNSPILYASEDSSSEGGKDYDESYTWTFYNIATIKGSVTIRWYGSSNGYYSESVNFYKIREANKTE